MQPTTRLTNRSPGGLSARALAAIRPDAALYAWLAQFAVDQSTHDALASEAAEAGAAMSFDGERPLVWRDIEHERFAILARFDYSTHYAIPHTATLPRGATGAVQRGRGSG